MQSHSKTCGPCGAFAYGQADDRTMVGLSVRKSAHAKEIRMKRKGTTIAVLEQLRANTQSAWNQAIQSAGEENSEKLKAAKKDAAEALEAFGEAVDMVAQAIELIEKARRLSAGWGDDRYEREALERIDPEAE